MSQTTPLRIYAQCAGICTTPTIHRLDVDGNYHCTTCAEDRLPASAAISPDQIPADHSHYLASGDCEHGFDIMGKLEACYCKTGMDADPQNLNCICRQCYVRRTTEDQTCPKCGTDLSQNQCPPSCTLANLTSP